MPDIINPLADLNPNIVLIVVGGGVAVFGIAVIGAMFLIYLNSQQKVVQTNYTRDNTGNIISQQTVLD